MYSTRLVEVRLDALAASRRFRPIEYPVPVVRECISRLSTVVDERGVLTRTLSDEEDAFIRNERVMGKISWRYWAERYATISLAAQAIGPMFPLWESQTLLLDRIGDLEWARYEEQHPDGVVVDILKDRQVGASTMAASFLAHRITTHPNVNALSASDVPESSTNVWDMLERIVDHLPWWMRPQILERTKNDEMVFSLGSRVLMGASKSTRGRDKTTRTAESAKGQLGRGRTLSCVHLSELATWTNPDQIDTALEPGIPVSPQTVWLKESTAQGKGPHNWWYQDWQLAKSGRGRSVAVFIPWYLERRRHWLPCPAGWVPAEETLAHARRIEESSPRWCRGRTYRPVREQLYWYEQAKAIAVTKDALEDFLAEHPADDEEAFQFSGKSVFSSLVRDRIRLQARPLAGMVTIKSNRELGTLP